MPCCAAILRPQVPGKHAFLCTSSPLQGAGAARRAARLRCARLRRHAALEALQVQRSALLQQGLPARQLARAPPRVPLLVCSGGRGSCVRRGQCGAAAVNALILKPGMPSSTMKAPLHTNCMQLCTPCNDCGMSGEAARRHAARRQRGRRRRREALNHRLCRRSGWSACALLDLAMPPAGAPTLQCRLRSSLGLFAGRGSRPSGPVAARPSRVAPIAASG